MGGRPSAAPYLSYAGEGVAMLRSGGDCLTRKSFLVSWFQSFLVSKFLGFKVSWFQSFLVSKWLGFLVSKLFGLSISWLHFLQNNSCFVDRYRSPLFSKSMSCFLEDIDLVFKILKNFKTDLHDFPVPIFSNIFKLLDFRNAEISKNNIF